MKKTHNLLGFIVKFYVFATVYALLTALIQKAFEAGYSTFNYGELALYILSSYGLKFIFLILIVQFLIPWLNNRVSAFSNVLIHIGLTIVFSIYATAVVWGIMELLLDEPYIASLEEFLINVAYGSSFNFFIYFSIIGIVYIYQYLEKQNKQELRESLLKSQLLDSKIKALQSKIHPHFLFNALNDILSIIDSDVEKGQDAIVDLSDLLRESMNLTDAKLITLDAELDLLRKYIDLEILRFGDRLKVQQVIDPDAHGFMVPPLLLQPIIENALKHGFSYQHDKLQIDLNISLMKDGKLFCHIKNNGVPLGQEKGGNGTGLRNLKDRLETIYGEGFTYFFCNDGNGNVSTQIYLPDQLPAPIENLGL